MKSDSELETVCVVQGELNAELIKSHLESEGIPSMLRFETYFNLQLAAFCPVSVLVSHKYVETAKQVIEPANQSLLLTVPAKNRWLFVLAYLLTRFSGY
jgi:hypothetical protein